MNRPTDDKAFAVATEMSELGAVFTVTDESRWLWEARPPVMRNAIRRFWQSIDDRPGGAEMVAAIRRMQGGAP